MRNKDGTASSRSNSPSINVTPLIDVLLVLLIIFMVIAPHRQEKLPVKAPQPAPAENPPSSQEILMLTVTGDAHLALNSQPVEIEDLPLLLSDLMQDRPADQRTLFIRAPKLVRYDSVLLLVDLAKGAGVATVGLLASEE